MAAAPHNFDVFISYRWVEPDQAWVRDSLVPALKSAGLRVCLDVEDFVPGRDLILEMNRAGTESRHALCILSPDYFQGNRMVGFESLMARRADPSGTESKLIPLIYRKVELPEWLRGLIPIDWTEPKHHSREWRKLLKVLAAPLVDTPEPGSPSQRSEANAVLAGPSKVVERCRALAEIFTPGTDGFDPRGWLREADGVTMGIWHHPGIPGTEDLGAVLDLWQLAINSGDESAGGKLAASVGEWRMAECLFTAPRERTTRILRALGLAENTPTAGLEDLLQRIDQLSAYLRDWLLSLGDGAFLSTRFGGIYNEAVSHLESVFGQEHPTIGLMLANCAICAAYSPCSDDQAHTLLDRAVEIADAHRSEGCARVLIAVAQVRSSLKTFTLQGGSLVPESSNAVAKRLALALSRSVGAIKARKGQGKTPLLLNLLNELGEVKLDMGEREEAEKCFRQAHKLSAQIPGKSQETIRPLIGLVDTLMSRDALDQAYEFLKSIPPDIALEPRIRQRLNIAEVMFQMRFSAHKQQGFEADTKKRLNLLSRKLKEEA